MPLDPSIILRGRSPDVAGSIQSGLNLRSSIDQMPFQNQLLQQRVDAGKRSAQSDNLQRQLFGAQKSIEAFEKNNIAGVIDGIREAFPGNDQRQAAEIAEFQKNPQLYISQAQDDLSAFQSRQGVAQKTSGQREFESLIQGLSEEDKVKAVRQKLFLDPKPGDSAEERIAKDKQLANLVAEVEGIKAKSKALGKGEGEFETKPKTEAATVKAKGEEEVKLAEQKQTQQINVKRISELSQSKRARSSAILKARKFLRALKSGEAGSGASRTAAAFVPGVFTSQAEFDEQLNAFSEVAAREKLKASGEIRPTDADVEGMKRAMFGIGRDEATNIQLLGEFISDQEDIDDELQDLSDAKEAKRLGTFTGQKARLKKTRLEELREKAGL